MLLSVRARFQLLGMGIVLLSATCATAGGHVASEASAREGKRMGTLRTLPSAVLAAPEGAMLEPKTIRPRLSRTITLGQQGGPAFFDDVRNTAGNPRSRAAPEFSAESHPATTYIVVSPPAAVVVPWSAYRYYGPSPAANVPRTAPLPTAPRSGATGVPLVGHDWPAIQNYGPAPMR